MPRLLLAFKVRMADGIRGDRGAIEGASFRENDTIVIPAQNFPIHPRPELSVSIWNKGYVAIGK